MTRRRKPHARWDARSWLALCLAGYEQHNDVSHTDILTFRSKVLRSKALNELLTRGARERRIYRIYVFNTLVALLPPRTSAVWTTDYGYTVQCYFSDTPEHRKVVRRSCERLEQAARILKKGNISDLAAECSTRAAEGRALVRPGRPGRKPTLQGHVIGSLAWGPNSAPGDRLHDVLPRDEPLNLTTRARNRLIAAIVTEFVKPIDEEEVRQILRQWPTLLAWYRIDEDNPWPIAHDLGPKSEGLVGGDNGGLPVTLLEAAGLVKPSGGRGQRIVDQAE